MQLTAKTVKTNNQSFGYYEALPDGYDPAKKYPILIMMHGQGEQGNGTAADLQKLLKIPPLSLISSGKLNLPWIVVAPQEKGSPYAYDITATLDYLINAKYGIDETRAYLGALSAGAVGLWDLARNMAVKRFAAMVVCSGAWDIQNSPQAAGSKVFRDEQFPIWAFHNQSDNSVPVTHTTSWIAAINAPTAKKTILPTTGHDSWVKAFDPTFKEDGKNVYEWLAQFTTKRGEIGTPVVVAPPPAPVFKSAPQVGTFTRNNCGEGSTGTAIDYTVPAGKFTAATQPEADKLAAAALAKEGQEFANANASCTPVRRLTCIVNVYSDGDVEIIPQ